MALADLVLEGLTLILVIALGLVLIGGLTYLTMTVTSANNARLAYAGLYVYLPQPFYANGTLYVPMFNIGYYRALVRYIYVRSSDGSIHRYTLDLVLNPNQYYVYRLSLGYEPLSITLVVSPTNYPNVVREFSANVTGITTVPLMTLSESGSGSGLVEVVVSDPYGAGWQVQWSYAGQTYSISQSQSYRWFINPPYVPIQISFMAKITQNPSANGINYTCSITPSQVSNSFGPGSVVTFNVQCTQTYYVIVQLYAPCHNANYGVQAWTNLQSVSVDGYQGSGTYTLYYTSNDPNGLGQVNFQAYATYIFFMGGSLTVYNESAPGSPVANQTSSWYNVGGTWGTEYSQVLTIDTLPGMVYKAVYSSPGCAYPAPQPTPNNQISVTVSDPYGAGWSVTWSGGASGSESNDTTSTWTITASSTVNFQASITSVPSGYNSCSITPQTTSANPGGSVTFTVTCTQSSPINNQLGCYLETSATSNESGVAVTVNPSGTTFLSPGQSEPVTFNAPTSQSIGGNYWYQFIDWVITTNASSDTNLPTNPYTTDNPSPSVTVTCPSGLNSTITISLSGTAQYVEDYYTVSGPTEVSQSGYYNVTLSWNLAPAFVKSVLWQVGYTSSSVNIDPISIYASNHEYQTSWYITPAPDACPSRWHAVISGVSPQGKITQDIPDETSGYTYITLDITLTCQQNKI